MANLYEILGVQEEASQEEIKTSYRKLSRRYHPDMTGDTEGHFFKMLAEAHETLIDPARRAAYDASLHNQPDPSRERTSEEQDDPSMYFQPHSVPPAQAGIPAATPINWDSVKWKQQSYQGREKVVLKKPFKGKALAFAALAAVFLIPAFYVSFRLPTFHDFPISLIAILAIAVFGFQLGRLKSDEKWFGVTAGVVIIANIVVVVLMGGAKLSDGILVSLLLAISSALIIYAYLAYVKWLIVQDARGALKKNGKQLKEGKKWVSTTRTIHPGGEAEQRANSVAEKRTERLVEELVDIPGTRMLNGVLHPTSTWEKVQHVAVNGDRIYLVDSLMLPGGKYYWLDRDTISAVRPAGYEYDVEVGTPTALREFEHTFIEAEVKACIVLYSLDGGEIELIDSNKSHDGVELFSSQEFVESAGEWFTEGKIGIINRGLMNGLINRL